MRSLYFFFSICTILIFLLIYFGFNEHWILGFLGLGFPIIIFIHFVLFVLILLFKPKAAFPSLLVLLVSGLMISRTYHLETDTGDSLNIKGDVTILSYNVGGSERRDATADDYRNWLVGTGADIMILPEFTNYGSGKHNVVKFLKNNGFVYLHTLNNNRYVNMDRLRGLTIFSKYPIVYARDTLFQELNGIIQADLKINNDTISVFGVHLYSMSLQLEELAHKRNVDFIKDKGWGIVTKIKNGFVHRKSEMALLMSWLAETKHPVFIGGDFNETPYSYSYSTLIGRYHNAFEEKGSGFGFTYADTPRFIRIDNQFYDADKIKILNFKTIRNVHFSDHFPLIGTYQLTDQ